ncbi:MAG: galactose-1-phosphate uridylyltransferase [Armatimonadetes bacterium]|nr:galactose-1-phosphate uridylyltransferase [Armatimonadota bacterium]
MPELRKNIITREWVVIATERSKRPDDFSVKKEIIKTKEEQNLEKSKCPFCPGNEHMTPPEILAYKSKNNFKGWQIRVIPNKFPALSPAGELSHNSVGIYDILNGIGVHEVIIETPEHYNDIISLSNSQMEELVSAYFERYNQLKNKFNLEHIIIFRNHGDRAGTSLLHPHSQLIATPVMPKEFWYEVEGASIYYEYEERCPYCHLLEFEDQDGERKIAENDSFIAIAFFASRYPFETWILPRIHNASFSQISMKEGNDLALILQDVLKRFYNCLGDPSYNLTLHSLLKPEKQAEAYHWHFKIIPRLTTPAGFELGTGMFINVSAPEEAAKFLRESKTEVVLT